MGTVFTIVGMHKSGTTLAAQILNESGVRMVTGHDQRSYDAGNKCERLSTNEMNKALLSCGTRNSLRVLQRYKPGERDGALHQRGLDIIAEAERDGGDNWGFKDPRSCLTHSFWSELIPDIKVICIYRSASSNRCHYTMRKSKIRNNGFRALRAWGAYNSAVIEIFEGTHPDRRILLNYDNLLAEDSEIKRLEAFVGLPLKDLRRPELNRRKQETTLLEKVETKLVKLGFGLDIPAIERRLQELLKNDRSRKSLSEAIL